MKLTIAFAVIGAVCLGGCRSDIGRFEKADLDGNGQLTQAEAGVYAGGNLFDGLDNNEDGKITSAEWNAGGNLMRVQNFRKADRNNDGVVTEEELQVTAVQSKQMAEFMRGADRDQNGSVSKGEALAYYASKEGPIR